MCEKKKKYIKIIQEHHKTAPDYNCFLSLAHSLVRSSLFATYRAIHSNHDGEAKQSSRKTKVVRIHVSPRKSLENWSNGSSGSSSQIAVIISIHYIQKQNFIVFRDSDAILLLYLFLSRTKNHSTSRNLEIFKFSCVSRFSSIFVSLYV